MAQEYTVTHTRTRIAPFLNAYAQHGEVFLVKNHTPLAIGALVAALLVAWMLWNVEDLHDEVWPAYAFGAFVLALGLASFIRVEYAMGPMGVTVTRSWKGWRFQAKALWQDHKPLFVLAWRVKRNGKSSSRGYALDARNPLSFQTTELAFPLSLKAAERMAEVLRGAGFSVNITAPPSSWFKRWMW